ncbi:hypothetical protein SPFM7_00010 [Salmonella phage SPFM7]|nr:hypothetical protein SPFM7_00010 [Salmonella phage SPFM7]
MTVEINELGFAFLDRVNERYLPAYIGYDKAFVKLHPHVKYEISTSQLDDIMERYKDLLPFDILWDYLQGILILREDDPEYRPVNPVPLPYLYHLYSPTLNKARDLDTRVEAYLSNWFPTPPDPTIPLRTLVSGDTYDLRDTREDNTVGVDIVQDGFPYSVDDKVIRVVGGGSLLLRDEVVFKHGFVSSGLLSNNSQFDCRDGDTNKVSVRCRGVTGELRIPIDYHTRWPEIVVVCKAWMADLWLPMETVEVWLNNHPLVHGSEGQIRIPIVARNQDGQQRTRHPTVIYDDFHLFFEVDVKVEGTDYTRDGNKITWTVDRTRGLWIRMVIGEVPTNDYYKAEDAVKIVDNAPDFEIEPGSNVVYIPRNPEARIIEAIAGEVSVYEYDADGLLLEHHRNAGYDELTSGGYRGTLPDLLATLSTTDAYGYNAAARYSADTPQRLESAANRLAAAKLRNITRDLCIGAMVGANSNVPEWTAAALEKPLYNSTHTHDLYRLSDEQIMNDIDELTIRLLIRDDFLDLNDISIPSMRISKYRTAFTNPKGEGRYYHRHRHQAVRQLTWIPKGDGIWIFNNDCEIQLLWCGDLQTFYSTLDQTRKYLLHAWDDVEIRVDGRIRRVIEYRYVDFWVNGKMIADPKPADIKPQQIQIVLDRYNLLKGQKIGGGENAPVVKPTFIEPYNPPNERYKWLDDTPCYLRIYAGNDNSVYFWRTLSGQIYMAIPQTVNNFHAWMQVYNEDGTIIPSHLNYGNLSIPPERWKKLTTCRNPIPLPGEGWWHAFVIDKLNIAPFRLTEKTGAIGFFKHGWLVAHAVKNAWQRPYLDGVLF